MLRKPAVFLAPIIVFMLASPSLADDALTSNGIIQKLLPTHKTRAFGSTGRALTADQEAFFNGLEGRTPQRLFADQACLAIVSRRIVRPTPSAS